MVIHNVSRIDPYIWINLQFKILAFNYSYENLSLNLWTTKWTEVNGQIIKSTSNLISNWDLLFNFKNLMVSHQMYWAQINSLIVVDRGELSFTRCCWFCHQYVNRRRQSVYGSDHIWVYRWIWKGFWRFGEKLYKCWHVWWNRTNMYK